LRHQRQARWTLAKQNRFQIQKERAAAFAAAPHYPTPVHNLEKLNSSFLYEIYMFNVCS
jgi:hypothetical protein